MSRLTLISRNGHWYLRKRVPVRYQELEKRRILNIALSTDSRAVAEQKAGTIWAQMIEAWEARMAGDTTEAEARFDAAKRLAAAKGFRFLDAERVARLPLNEVLKRVEASVNRRGEPDLVTAKALLGAAKPPPVAVSRVMDLFYEIEGARVLGKSDDQLRRHKAPRLKATRNFIKVVGDRPIAEITTADLFQFRGWWLDRIGKGEVTRGSANKDMAYLLAMWRAVARAKEIELQFRSDALMFDEGKKRTRPPFSSEWITEKLIPGLAGMNAEARDITLIMVNTGARPSEISGLRRDRIVLDHAVPHINIAPDGRTLKTESSERTIPLVGVSLEAAQRHPDGFPTYFDNPSLSDTVNKYMRENGLRETPKHVMYSLRHSFEDRMLEAGIDERVRRDLLGHSLNRERYGKGGTLEHVRDLLLKIAL